MDKKLLRVLVACEFSGVVRDAFAERGHHAVSCDLLPSEAPGLHYRGDVRDILDRDWDLMIAHPPCTYLAVSGLHWDKVDPSRFAKIAKALEFVQLLMNAPIPMIAIENPIGLISTRIRKADQIIQPYEFGEDASKATCFWLKGLQRLKPTRYIEPRRVCCDVTIVGDRCMKCGGRFTSLPRWGNQDNLGRNNVPRGANRGHERSRTFPGVAKAMARQWGARWRAPQGGPLVG